MAADIEGEVTAIERSRALFKGRHDDLKRGVWAGISGPGLARFEAAVAVETASAYNFTVASRDGAMLWADGEVRAAPSAHSRRRRSPPRASAGGAEHLGPGG